MNAKIKARRFWLLNSLNYKVHQMVDKKISVVLNNTNPDIEHINTLEDVSQLLSLEWKINNQTYQLKTQLERLKEKVGAQG